jgi:hypothetical protein
MKTRIIGMVLFTLLLCVSGARADKGVGLGVIIGEPTGITVKKWLSYNHAVDAGAGWSFSENNSVHFHADYLFHNFDLLDAGSLGGRLPVYFGLGGRLKLQNHDNDRGRNHDHALAGARLPLGIAYEFPRDPVELFAEIVPVVDLIPDADFDINAAVGVRFYFK